jgi:exodeoxyribonuclease V alpha subunit
MMPLPSIIDDGGERALDQTLARWVMHRTGSTVLAEAARSASSAEGQGHSCAWLADPHADTGFDAEALAALRAHAWVGDGSRFAPFVLDAEGRFYLWRNWQHEKRLAEAILQRSQHRSMPVDGDVLAKDLDALFAGMPAEYTRWQRAAVALVPGAHLFVLTGGPGTGKTTTVVRMLLMLLMHAKACGLPATPSIALAAPTGKAAQRLVQAIAKGKAELQGSLDPAGAHRRITSVDTLLQQIPHAEARTLHRLLGYQPRENSFRHGAGNPLAEDIIVVDEASMVDLAMMRQLLEAVRPEAVLILLGDPGQLASVDAGSVLADIVAGTPQNLLPAAMHRLLDLAPGQDRAPESSANTSPLAGQVLTLSHSWRAGSGLQASIDAMRGTPDPAWLEALLTRRGSGDLHLKRCDDNRDVQACIDGWIEHHEHLLRALLTPSIEPSDALRELGQIQILCALREGPFGAQGINLRFAQRLASRFDIDTSQAWYHGRPVIITRNDYAHGLFNGDIGIALNGATGLRVWFETSERDGQPGLRSFSPRALPAHETAWAITIHRSQGSEYRDVAVVLPADADHRILTRELVYTATSRARSRAEIWATDGSLCAALDRPIQREGGLREMLQQPGKRQDSK